MKKLTFLYFFLIVLSTFSQMKEDDFQDNKNDRKITEEDYKKTEDYKRYQEFLKNNNNLEEFYEKQRGTLVKKVKEQSAKYTYKAIIIATEKYEDVKFGNLNFPINDAIRLIKVLTQNYTFNKQNIVFVKNPNREQLFKIFEKASEEIKKDDILLIFYAGHGIYNKGLKRGYWLPSNANSNSKHNWFSYADLTDQIAFFKSQHTLLIIDACFSGSIFRLNRGIKEEEEEEDLSIEALIDKKSRKAMTSGLDKTVPDDSVFIKYLIRSLEKNKESFMTAEELFSSIRKPVSYNSKNNPQYNYLINTNHEGGEFVFIKKEKN